MQDNLSMLADFYEFTMVNGFFENGMEHTIGYYDMFFRSVPDEGGFAIMAGLGSVIDYLKNLHFTKEDIAYFESKKIFGKKMLEYLEHFKFECDVWAVKEGMPIFPGETADCSSRSDCPSAAFRDDAAFNHQSSKFDCHENQSHCSGSSWTTGHGIRLQTGSGAQCCYYGS